MGNAQPTECINVRCNWCMRSLVGVNCTDTKCAEGGMACGLKPMLALYAASQELAELREISQRAARKLRSIGRIFCGPNFTDRGRDGPIMIELADKLDALSGGKPQKGEGE